MGLVEGGLAAVIYTDTLQAVLMIAGALALMGKGKTAICMLTLHYDLTGFVKKTINCNKLVLFNLLG